MTTDLTPGDRIEYFLPALGWEKATVKKVTGRRIVIVLDDYPAHSRNTVPTQVRKCTLSKEDFLMTRARE